MTPVRLAVDVSSGDFGAEVIVKGVLDARLLCDEPFRMRLCGPRDDITRVLKDLGVSIGEYDDIEIEHCDDCISSDDIPSRVWKYKAHAPIIRCIALQKEEKADASVTAGDSGILMAASIFNLGREKGVSRPALGAFLPTTAGKTTLLLDVGANLECRVPHLVSFALMGSRYIQQICGIDIPRVALLNVGKEAVKGTKVIHKTGAVLKRQCPGYCGYIEASNILTGEADVVVCDGFVGNAVLKACESYYALTEAVLHDNTFLLRALKSSMSILNAENYGAVPLLGVKGVVLKAHGNSSPKAIANAVLTAVAVVKQRRSHGEDSGRKRYCAHEV